MSKLLTFPTSGRSLKSASAPLLATGFVLLASPGSAWAGSPNGGNPPSTPPRAVNDLSSMFMTYALYALIIGVMVSAALWAMGSKGQNPGTELAGKKGLLICVTAAFFLGAMSPWINYLRGLAEEADDNNVLRTPVATAPPQVQTPGSAPGVGVTPGPAGSGAPTGATPPAGQQGGPQIQIPGLTPGG